MYEGHPHMCMRVIHICVCGSCTYLDEGHPHMWMWLMCAGAYIYVVGSMWYMYICGCGREHMWLTTWAYVVDHMGICGWAHGLLLFIKCYNEYKGLFIIKLISILIGKYTSHHGGTHMDIDSHTSRAVVF